MSHAAIARRLTRLEAREREKANLAEFIEATDKALAADAAVSERYYGLPEAAEYEADRVAAMRLHERGLMSNEEATRLMQRMWIRIESDRMEHERKSKRRRG